MASVTPAKRANGFPWIVQARDDARTMRRETFDHPDDPRAAERAARDFARLVDRVGITEASRQRDERDGARAGSLTLAAWIDQYVDPESGIWRGVNDSGREGGRRAAATYITPRLGELPVSAIAYDDVAQWMIWMSRQPSPRGGTLSAKTIRNHHALLSQILTAAATRGHRTGNPARGQKPNRQARKQPMVVLTQREFETLVHFIRPAWRPFFRFLAGTGMRFGEATALTWADLSPIPGGALVHITKAWQKPPTGSGLRVLGPPKSDAGERSIGVPADLIADLGTPGRPDELVFTNRDGGALWSGTIWSRVWAPALTAANDAEKCAAAGRTPIGKRPRIHDLRHCHASWMIAAGRPLPYIQARLGHEKITTTVDTYGHLLPDAQMGDIAAVTAIMSIAPEPLAIGSTSDG